MWEGILAEIRSEPLKVSLGSKGLEPKPDPLPPLKCYEPRSPPIPSFRAVSVIIEHR
jgi:hypothetical protein